MQKRICNGLDAGLEKDHWYICLQANEFFCINSFKLQTKSFLIIVLFYFTLYDYESMDHFQMMHIRSKKLDHVQHTILQIS